MVCGGLDSLDSLEHSGLQWRGDSESCGFAREGLSSSLALAYWEDEGIYFLYVSGLHNQMCASGRRPHLA